MLSTWATKAFSPSKLFNANEIGAWFDPSDITTLFQDSAGATPVTAVEQTVGRMLDKSGRGNHATQATAGSRPTLSALYNLQTYSEQFDNAAWTKNDLTVSANAIVAPDGTTTGDQLVQNLVASGHYINSTLISVTLGLSYTYAVYAKGDASNQWVQTAFASAGFGSTAWANFNVYTGALGFKGAGATATITSVGDGWYRCAITSTATVTATAGPAVVLLNNADTNNRVPSFTGDGVSGIYVWGADMRLANQTSIPYQRVVTATNYDSDQSKYPWYLRFNGTASNMVTSTIDFINSTIGARRNLLTYTQEFDDTAWTKTNINVTANAVSAPDSTTTAEKIIATAINASHEIRTPSTSLTAGTYTQSVYGKQAEYRYLRVGFGSAFGGSAGYCIFDLQTGTVTYSSNAGLISSMVDVGSGWYRCSVTNTTTVSISSTNYIGISNTSTTGTTFLGDDVSGIYIWGAQLEAGSTATAYQRVGTDKVMMISGARKLSDAATAVIAEYSASSVTNNGSFGTLAPNGINEYSWRSRGTVTVGPNIDSASYAAPITHVITGIGDITGDVATIRANGAQIATSSTDQGNSNYLNYPLYIGSRGGTSLFFNGQLYGLIVRGGQSSIAEITLAENWMNSKAEAF